MSVRRYIKEEESDEETEDYDYAEDKKQTKETKPENRGKPIWARRAASW